MAVENCLDTVLTAELKAQLTGLHAHLTSMLSISFCGDILKQTYVPLQSILQMSYGVEFNDLKLKQEIHTESSNDCEFHLPPVPSFVSMNMEAILSSSCKKVK